MKKSDKPVFTDFLIDEATKYRVAITKPEIDLWFETFERSTMEDFRNSWVEHKRDEKVGGLFPKIPWMQRRLRTTGDDKAERDWRCAAELDQRRCGFPGAISESIHGGGPYHCAAHFRLYQSEFTKQAVAEGSRQIIERSEAYKAPTSFDELYAMNDVRRAAARKQAEMQNPRRPSDRIEMPRFGQGEAQPRLVMREDIDRANLAAALAAQEES